MGGRTSLKLDPINVGGNAFWEADSGRQRTRNGPAGKARRVAHFLAHRVAWAPRGAIKAPQWGIGTRFPLFKTLPDPACPGGVFNPGARGSLTIQTVYLIPALGLVSACTSRLWSHALPRIGSSLPDQAVLRTRRSPPPDHTEHD